MATKKKKPKTKQAAKAKTVRYTKVKDEMLSQTKVSSFQVVRLSRIKYEGDAHEVIDIRLYQRGFDKNENEVFYPTRKGVQIKESTFLKLMKGY